MWWKCLPLAFGLSLSAHLAHGQNLILNPGFEELEVPCVGGPATFSSLQAWTHPVCSENVSFAHACSAALGFPTHGTPANLIGYQEPVDGLGYVAMYTYDRYSTFPPSYYLTGPLLVPLDGGTEYCFSLHVSLADQSAYRTSYLHVIFTEELPNSCNGVDTLVWVHDAQVVLNTTDADTSSWSLLSGSFVAAGGESYLTIGNFVGMLDPDTMYFGPTTFPAQRAMYYIDALELRPCVVAVEEYEEMTLRTTYDPGSRSLSIIGLPKTNWNRVVLLDMAGRMVTSHPGRLGSVQIDVSGLSAGFYIIQAVAAGKQYSTRVAIF